MVENFSELLELFLENFADVFAVEIRVILEPLQDKALEHLMPFTIALLKSYRRLLEIPLIICLRRIIPRTIKFTNLRTQTVLQP
jgi:hypothetical protein